MKTLFVSTVLASTCLAGVEVNAFLAPNNVKTDVMTHLYSQKLVSDDVTTRQDFFKTLSVGTVGIVSMAGMIPIEPASARGRATLEKTYERYAPRIRAGGQFYANELRQFVAKDDWKSIKDALAEPPSRQKADLNKPDAGVAERARLSGGFSDARVLVAADLFAAAFSESSISSKTKAMQSAIAKEREILSEMSSIAKQALGEESSGGLFGLGAKKPNIPELSKKMKALYVEGGNTWNEYVMAANDNLALQFDRFEYIK